VTNPESGGGPAGRWHPDERVGDIYSVKIGDDGQIERAERLTEVPRIWVGSWLDYNNGVLYGEWIDAVQDEEALQSDIAAMLAASPTTAETGEPAEDWGIFDYDNFGSLRIGEQESLGWVSAVARDIDEHSLAFAAYADVMQDEDALIGFEDNYLGRYESLEAYAEELIEDAGYERLLDEHVPEGIRAYVRIDIEALAHDMFLSGELHVLHTPDGGVWLFRAE
jgi:antirestriction protein